MDQRMRNSSFEVIRLSSESATTGSYDNHPITTVNDHEVRISTMTEAYHWHCHPDSDECFLALEGGLFIDFDDQTIELLPGHLITVPRPRRSSSDKACWRAFRQSHIRAGWSTERDD